MYPWNPERYIVKSVLMSKKNTEKTLMAILLAFYSSPVKAKFSQMISSGSKIPSMSRLLPNKRCCFFSFLEDRKQDSRQFLGYYSLYLSRTVLLVSQCLNTTKMYCISLILWLLEILVTDRLSMSWGGLCCTSCLYLSSKRFYFSSKTLSSSYLSGIASSLYAPLKSLLLILLISSWISCMRKTH